MSLAKADDDDIAARAVLLPGVILGGGRASRMGGGDKGLRLLAGRPLLAHVIERMAPQLGPLAINANGDPARLASLGLPVLSDPLPGQLGPLAGVLTAMAWAAQLGSDSVVTVATDTPFLPPDLVARLRQEAARSGSGLTMAASRDARGLEQVHPICGLWPVSLRATLERDLRAGARRVRDWAGAQGVALAVFACAGGDPFFNVNTPADLARAEVMARSQRG